MRDRLYLPLLALMLGGFSGVFIEDVLVWLDVPLGPVVVPPLAQRPPLCL